MAPIKIPQHHDDPRWILIWPIDELLPIFMSVPIGMMIEQVILSVAAGFIISRFYKTGKMMRHNGYVQHFLYSKGFFPFSRTKTFRNTFNRRYLPK